MIKRNIKGIEINYYFICHTKLWFFSHNITMEETSDIVKEGKFLHENTYKRETEYLIDNIINIDFLKEKDPIEIHEVKKTKSMQKSHKYQILYYMFYLKKYKGIKNIIGYLDYPSIKKKEKIILTKEDEEYITTIITEIKAIISKETPPSPNKKEICNKCSYYELCWV